MHTTRIPAFRVCKDLSREAARPHQSRSSARCSLPLGLRLRGLGLERRRLGACLETYAPVPRPRNGDWINFIIWVGRMGVGAGAAAQWRKDCRGTVLNCLYPHFNVKGGCGLVEDMRPQSACNAQSGATAGQWRSPTVDAQSRWSCCSQRPHRYVHCELFHPDVALRSADSLTAPSLANVSPQPCFVLRTGVHTDCHVGSRPTRVSSASLTAGISCDPALRHRTTGPPQPSDVSL